MRLFGALANARARYNEGALKGQQYTDEQDRIRRDETRRAFEFKAQDDRLRDQVRLMQQEREAARQQQEELKVAGLLQQGWEDWEGLGADPIQGDAPVRQEVDGRVFEAPKAGGVRQTSVGTRRLRFDPQRQANRDTQKLFETYLTNKTMQDDRQAAAQQLEAQRANDRRDLQALIASLRPPPASAQPRPVSEAATKEIAVLTDLATNAKAAIDAIEAGRQAGGKTGGPAAWVGRNVRRYSGQDPTSADLAAANTQRVLAQIRNKLLGASQTTTELQSTKEFLPMLESSNDAFIIEALRGIGRDAEQAARRRTDIMRASGRNADGVAAYLQGLPSFDEPTQGRPAPKPGAPTPNRPVQRPEDEARVQAALRRAGIRP